MTLMIGGCSAGVSTGICLVLLLFTRNLLHGPMTLLANLVALPVDVSARHLPLHHVWSSSVGSCYS